MISIFSGKEKKKKINSTKKRSRAKTFAKSHKGTHTIYVKCVKIATLSVIHWIFQKVLYAFANYANLIKFLSLSLDHFSILDMYSFFLIFFLLLLLLSRAFLYRFFIVSSIRKFEQHCDIDSTPGKMNEIYGSDNHDKVEGMIHSKFNLGIKCQMLWLNSFEYFETSSESWSVDTLKEPLKQEPTHCFV